MKSNNIFFIVAILLFSGFISCKKDDAGSGTKAVFSYVADGFKANFTNFSRGATTYSWNFGDGDTSNLKSPVHIFKSKGDYLVTLKAFSNGVANTFIDTVSIYGPNIKIDGDFTDWDYVSYTVEDATAGNTITGVKTFANKDYLFFLLEGTTDMTFTVMHIYLDTDNNPATGFQSGQYVAKSGADYMFEGSILGKWGDFYKHNHPTGGWGWDAIGGYDVILASPVKTVSGKNYVEIAVKTAKLGNLKTAVNFAITEGDAGWNDIGGIPRMGDSSKFALLKL